MKIIYNAIIISTIYCFFLVSCKPINEAENGFIYANNGRLYFPDGKELALWGVNLQPCLSWEYNSLFDLIGVPLNSDTLKKATIDALDEIKKMNCDLIRCHLTPTDFTDSEGNLVETVYLDMLDYMIAKAADKGMYSYITFLNPGMSYDIDVEDPGANIPSYVENSFLKGIERRDIIFNRDVVQKSEKFIYQLLNRKNPYLNKKYKDTEEIAVWEIVNEPTYFSYEQIKETDYYSDFLKWAKENELIDNQANYRKYRHDLVYNYINNMYDHIRETGAVQPIVWNCNWNQMIRNNEEVFDAIGASKVEVVSFCNYPGQSVCKRPYTKNPVNLSQHDFTSFFQDCYSQKDWYKWALRPDFMKKAKVAYEFEIFYNQSKYLYPAQVDFFRAMGVQMASMWHYSMPRYAPYRNGSHHLSLTSTPGKAASYAVAGELFRNLPLYHQYDITSPVEKNEPDYMYSFKHDLSAYSSKNIYVHAGNMNQPEGILPKLGVKKVLAFGNSPLVDYDGNGIYTMDIFENEIAIEIQPNTIQLKPLWGKDFLVDLVTQLDYSVPHLFVLNLNGWTAENCQLYNILNDNETPISSIKSDRVSFYALPGKYKIKKTD